MTNQSFSDAMKEGGVYMTDHGPLNIRFGVVRQKMKVEGETIINVKENERLSTKTFKTYDEAIQYIGYYAHIMDDETYWYKIETVFIK